MPASLKRKLQNYISPLFDDRGHPSPQVDWESMLPEVKTGRLLRKHKHNSPKLQYIDPDCGEVYDNNKHGEILRAELNMNHFTTVQQSFLTVVVKKYWRVFIKKGVTTVVKYYECEIDTGNARPIRCRNTTFGPLETPLIKKSITKLVELGHAKQIYHGQWLSKPLLAAKPHQENITEIEDFVWRFCVNYTALNSVTKIIAMPIPRCDTSVGISCGGSIWKWLMDAISGYNQIRVSKSFQEKLAFSGPKCTNYTYSVMSFGPINAPVIFIVFIHDMDSTWKGISNTRGIVIDAKSVTRLIVDDIYSWT